MIALSDYKNYFGNNLQLINNLKNNKFSIYERLREVIYVLDYIADNYELYKNHESSVDFEDIFEVGFSYFHSEFEQIKIYYETYLNKDIILLKKYDPLINLSLYVDDFVETLKEKDYFTDSREEALKEVLEDIEEIIKNKKEWTGDDLENFNLKVSSCVPFKVDIITTQEIFLKIAEEIMILKG